VMAARGHGRLKGLLSIATRWFCRPLTVIGADRTLRSNDVVFVANHSSHADTAAVLAAMPRDVRRGLAPAAAEDYFFRSRVRGGIVRALTGAFPFPRHGTDGIERAWSLLRSGRSVLLYPEGTRSRDGSIAPFKCGVGILARRGVTVVPVGIAGTKNVLSKGRRLPSQASVSVAFGHPRRFEAHLPPAEIAESLRKDVCRLATEADRARAPKRSTLFERVARFAGSRAALWLVFAWAVAEAMWWPVIPDFLVGVLVLAAPTRWLVLAGTATAGSVLGGAIGFHLGMTGEWVASQALFLTPRMHEQAVMWMSEQGAVGLLRQPLSGIPYKVFALHAADTSMAFPGFVGMSLAARGLRLVAVAGLFAGGGIALRRLWPRIFGTFLVAYCVVFAFGLAATIESWR
jgi:1-acyl-sn-glycerol-3-phosphate acyltransferase